VIFLWCIGVALATDSSVVEQAAKLEIDRALSSLRLPDQEGPYEVEVSVVDGDYSTSHSTFGQVISHESSPYLSARVEVRVGDLKVDSTNFSGLYGVPDGVERRTLPTDPVAIALRRELWLAMDSAYKGASQQLAGKLAAREGQQREYTQDATAIPVLVQAPTLSRPVDGERVRALSIALSAPLAAHPELESGDVAGRDWQGSRLLISSTGTKAWVRTGHTVYRAEAQTRAKSGAVIRNTRSWIARTPDQLPKLEQMVADVKAMADWTLAVRDAPVEEDYLGPVLFEPQAATEVFRQLLQPQVCGTPPMEDSPDPEGGDGISPPTARVGRRLLPAGWSVVDDPTSSQTLAGAYTHDMEGSPAQKVVLVEDGVIRDLLMSRVPRKDLKGSTGHARALGTARRAAMPGIITITPPRTVSDRALRKKALALARGAGLPYVMVVRRIAAPAMDNDFRIAFSGGAPLPGLTTPLELYRLYPDGREVPVRNVSFSGVDRRVLRDIVAAGRGLGPVNVMDVPGSSGRSGIGEVGGLPATWSAPQILISEIELRGQPGGEQRVIPPPKP
jgi:hypothetical protein